MAKLRWEKARRSHGGYATIGHGPDEIAGNERWSWVTRDGQASPATSKMPRRVGKATKSGASPSTGKAERSWPNIADGTGAKKAKLDRARKGSDGPARGQGSSEKVLKVSKPNDNVVVPVGAKKRLRREVLSYLIRMGPGRTEEELSKAIYGAAGNGQQVSKDCDILVRDGWAERKAQGSDRTLSRYFPKV